MGKYVDIGRVVLRLQGKVRLTDNPTEFPDRMTLQLANQLLDEAEAQVEYDLSRRYATPFVGVNGVAFGSLPTPTVYQIRTMCELLAVVRILETDFGMGSASDGSKYTAGMQKRYETMRDQVMEIKKGTYQTWTQPPLPGLARAGFNQAVDDGFQGAVMRTDDHHSSAGYAAQQINDPSEDFWNGTVEGSPGGTGWPVD